jgi:CMP/dCMP kinase
VTPRKLPIVAIDGPAGAGKSTVTRIVAERLGYLLVDTGALYRAVALAAERDGVPWDEAAGVTALAERLARERALALDRAPDGSMLVLLNDENVSGAIRTLEMGQGASKVSAIGGVRDALLGLQRSLGERGGVVLEGRDIGTVVFPDAEAKFFLTASVEVRAQRRYEELVARGQSTSLERVQREVRERDERDSSRPVAPLRKAQDAIEVDSSGLSIDEVVDSMVERVRRIEKVLAGAAARR